MFKKAEIRKITWPVKIAVPHDGGTVREHEMDVELEILDQDVHDELLEARGDLLARVVRGWGRYKQEDGQTDVQFTDEEKTAFLKKPYVRIALLRGYYEASQGRKAERKNG